MTSRPPRRRHVRPAPPRRTAARGALALAATLVVAAWPRAAGRRPCRRRRGGPGRRLGRRARRGRRARPSTGTCTAATTRLNTFVNGVVADRLADARRHAQPGADQRHRRRRQQGARREAGRAHQRRRRRRDLGQRRELRHRRPGRPLALRLGRRPAQRAVRRPRRPRGRHRLRRPGRRAARRPGSRPTRRWSTTAPSSTRPTSPRSRRSSLGRGATPAGSPTRRRRTSPGRWRCAPSSTTPSAARQPLLGTEPDDEADVYAAATRRDLRPAQRPRAEPVARRVDLPAEPGGRREAVRRRRDQRVLHLRSRRGRSEGGRRRLSRRPTREAVLGVGNISNVSFVTIPANAEHQAGALVLANVLQDPEVQLALFAGQRHLPGDRRHHDRPGDLQARLRGRRGQPLGADPRRRSPPTPSPSWPAPTWPGSRRTGRPGSCSSRGRRPPCRPPDRSRPPVGPATTAPLPSRPGSPAPGAGAGRGRRLLRRRRRAGGAAEPRAPAVPRRDRLVARRLPHRRRRPGGPGLARADAARRRCSRPLLSTVLGVGLALRRTALGPRRPLTTLFQGTLAVPAPGRGAVHRAAAVAVGAALAGSRHARASSTGASDVPGADQRRASAGGSSRSTRGRRRRSSRSSPWLP